jgi:Uma2 family endonuclease
MSVADPPPMTHAKVRTFADLLEALGNIPPNRILLFPSPGTATEADVLRLDGRADRRLCELVDGTLVEKGMGLRESLLAVFISSVLGPYCRLRNLGIVSGEQGTLRLWEGLVRIPDVAFISWDTLPGRRIPDEPIPELAPDLAVEVLSESNTRAEMDRKRQEYFRAGTRLVWEVDPRTRTVAIYNSADNPVTLRAADVLDGGSVVPGFTLPLSELFGELDRHG